MKQIRNMFLLMAAALLVAVILIPSTAGAYSRGHFYVIGTGPAGPQTATLQALATIKRMDVLIAGKQHVKLFVEYVGKKPVLFDPWQGLFAYNEKHQWELDKDELTKFEAERFRLRDQRVDRIKQALKEGKDVGLLDSGNPCLYGPSHWYVEQLDPQDVIVIPGMGCDAAAMAALGKSTIPAHDAHFVVQTAPFSLMRWRFEEREALKDLSKHPSTIIMYMALWEPDKVFQALEEVFPSDMPCSVVYWAGHPEKERVLSGTVGDMGGRLAQEKEEYMGLLLVGRFLEGKPYESAMKRHHEELSLVAGQNK
jgi:precorrin-4 methylase